MSTSIAISAAQGVLNNLIPLAAEQIRGVRGFEEELENLRRRQTTIQALFRDAENPRITLEIMCEWLKNLKLVTCDAENVLDEFAYEVLRRKLEVQNHMRNKVRNFFSLSNPLAFRLKMASKVKHINSKLGLICKEANDLLGPATIALYGRTVEPREVNFRLTRHFVEDSQVVGRDDDVSRVIDMLLGSETRDKSVIAIQGMAGMGKTTLAQLVYKDDKVVKNFGDQRIWICVSDDFGVKKLLNDMANYLLGYKFETYDIEGTMRKLKEKLNGKKYLLVLDDVWEENPREWEDMKNHLLEIGGSKGSKIIATTRSMDVVSAMRMSSLTHHVSQLSEDDSWTMFRKRAFANEGPTETPTLVGIGRKMVANCKGVPLAIKSLGGLMSSKHNEDEWRSIGESEIWSSIKDEIQPILRLSFDHLPSSSLKQCFAYCSIFPKDFNIQRDRMIQLWMGQGYLQPPSESNLEMEDVGNNYFNILLRNSLFQDVTLDEFNNITYCKMHDLVHDLALNVAEGNCQKLISIAGEVNYHPEVQHLSLGSWVGTGFKIPKENVGKLRTLFVNYKFPTNIAKVKCTRALSMGNFLEKELPSAVCKLIHLRYIELSLSYIEKLPNSITKLYNLQTLRLSYLTNLKKFPKKFYKLVSLRHLYIDGGWAKKNKLMMPMKIGQLTNLQTLPYFVVGKNRGHKIEELGSLNHLKGKLMIYNLQQVEGKEEAEKANISGKPNIHELALYWDRDGTESDIDYEINHEDVLEGLKPHCNLKVLKLDEFNGQRFASWMMSRDAQLLQNLVIIELSDCDGCEQIPPLGHLPHLEVIIMSGLYSVKRIGPEFCGLHNSVINSGVAAATEGAPAAVVFPVLRVLNLVGMANLEEWCGPPGVSSYSSPSPPPDITMFFPRLETLRIQGCPKLATVPGHLFSLQELIISRDGLFGIPKKTYRSCLIIDAGSNSSSEALVADLLEKNSQTLRILRLDKLGYIPCLLPKNVQILASLEGLEICNCLYSMPIIQETEEEDVAAASTSTSTTSSGRTGSLQWLFISNFPDLRSLKGLLHQTLVTLEILYCRNLIMADHHPDELRSLTSVQKLKIVGCPRLANFWVDIPLICLTSLRELTIGGFSKELEYFPWPSCSSSTIVSDVVASTTSAEEVDDKKYHPHPKHYYPFISLKSLTLFDWRRLKNLPDQLQHLTALRELLIFQFGGLVALPEWLRNLSSLHSLELSYCESLMNLPTLEAMQCLTNLRSLEIRYCPLLKERCARESGQEWHKIAHIPSIAIYDS